MKEIKGGVTAPQGFRANGVHAGAFRVWATCVTTLPLRLFWVA